jgi:hypothetical protein
VLEAEATLDDFILLHRQTHAAVVPGDAVAVVVVASRSASACTADTKVRAAGDEMDLGADAMERGADICADGTGADNCDFHGALRSVERPSEGGTVGVDTWVESTEYCLQYAFRVVKGRHILRESSKVRPPNLWDHMPSYRVVAAKTG